MTILSSRLAPLTVFVGLSLLVCKIVLVTWDSPNRWPLSFFFPGATTLVWRGSLGKRHKEEMFCPGSLHFCCLDPCQSFWDNFVLWTKSFRRQSLTFRQERLNCWCSCSLATYKPYHWHRSHFVLISDIFNDCTLHFFWNILKWDIWHHLKNVFHCFRLFSSSPRPGSVIQAAAVRQSADPKGPKDTSLRSWRRKTSTNRAKHPEEKKRFPKKTPDQNLIWIW